MVTHGSIAYPGDASIAEVSVSKHDPESAGVNAGVHIDGILAAEISIMSGRYLRAVQVREYMPVEEVRWTSTGILSYLINNHNDQKGGGSTVKRGDMV